MRSFLLIPALIACLCSTSARAAKLSFETGYVEPFYVPQATVIWAATNPLPATVGIYEVVPTSFSPAAVAALAELGGTANSPAGVMRLDKQIEVSLSSLQDVPDEARAFELGTNLLAILEIPLNELESKDGQPKARYYQGQRGGFDRTVQRLVTKPCTMGIEFQRVVDGIPLHGQRVLIQFESDEALTRLDAHWPGLKRIDTHNTATPAEMLIWIKEGRARAHPIETTGSRWIDLADVQKVIVRDIQIIYDTGNQAMLGASIPKRLNPYALISVDIEFSATDKEELVLSCPVIKEVLSSPLRRTAEFNILPRNFHETASAQGGNP